MLSRPTPYIFGKAIGKTPDNTRVKYVSERKFGTGGSVCITCRFANAFVCRLASIAHGVSVTTTINLRGKSRMSRTTSLE